MELLARQVADEAPRVRLEALLTLSDIRTPEAASLALQVLKQPTDYYLDYVLKETLATLEPNWKPLLLQGRDLAQNNPKGAEYLLAWLNTPELVQLAKAAGSARVYETILSRSGAGAETLGTALKGIAEANGTSPLEELNRALQRAKGDARKDLVQLLVRWDAAELTKMRPVLEQLATKDEDATIRQAGFAALIRADGSPDQAWQLASASPKLLPDLLDGTGLIEDSKLLKSLYPKIQPLLASATSVQAAADAKVVSGRYVRIEVPGDFSTVALAEVQVFSGGRNVALKGTATQASTLWRSCGGACDRWPHRRRVAGRHDREHA
jgi:hypothetical protein